MQAARRTGAGVQVTTGDGNVAVAQLGLHYWQGCASVDGMAGKGMSPPVG